MTTFKEKFYKLRCDIVYVISITCIISGEKRETSKCQQSVCLLNSTITFQIRSIWKINGLLDLNCSAVMSFINSFI